MTATAYEAGTYIQVPPGKLLIARNIRDPKPDPELVASIRELGVLEPITVVIAADGDMVVKFGHRRTLAAIEAGLETVPVVVVGADVVDNAAEIDRIVRQRDENTHRTGLTAADEVGVVEQLTLLGVPAEQLAGRARMDQSKVDHATQVLASKLATTTARKYDELSLEHVAAVAEFDADKDTAKALVAAAAKQPEQFPHVLQRARDDRDREAARLVGVETATEAGHKVIDAPDTSYGSTVKTKRIDGLVDADTGKDLTVATHKKCPGRVVWIRVTATLVDGHRAFTHELVHGCKDPAKYKHRDRHATSRATPKVDKTAAEIERERKSRRLVIDNNKAWEAATVVRREWLANLCNRKSAPKGSAAFIVQALMRDRYMLHDADGNQLAGEWLGSLDTAVKNDSQGHLVVLVVILAAYEKAVGKDDWRRDGTSKAGGFMGQTGRYLRFLDSIGYPLSDVELYATSSKTA